jgi:hypothetical protein
VRILDAMKNFELISRVLPGLGLGAGLLALTTGCQPFGYKAKAASECACPTDIRKTVPWCAGEDAIFHCPCGPSGPTFGARPTCWREWPIPATEWRDMHCSGMLGSACVTDAHQVPMTPILPAEPVDAAPTQALPPLPPSTQQPLFHPPYPKPLPAVGGAQLRLPASIDPWWSGMDAAVAGHNSVSAPTRLAQEASTDASAQETDESVPADDPATGARAVAAAPRGDAALHDAAPLRSGVESATAQAAGPAAGRPWAAALLRAAQNGTASTPDAPAAAAEVVRLPDARPEAAGRNGIRLTAGEQPPASEAVQQAISVEAGNNPFIRWLPPSNP